MPQADETVQKSSAASPPTRTAELAQPARPAGELEGDPTCGFRTHLPPSELSAKSPDA
jgi:hypothetical protein